MDNCGHDAFVFLIHCGIRCRTSDRSGTCPQTSYVGPKNAGVAPWIERSPRQLSGDPRARLSASPSDGARLAWHEFMRFPVLAFTLATLAACSSAPSDGGGGANGGSNETWGDGKELTT